MKKSDKIMILLWAVILFLIFILDKEIIRIPLTVGGIICIYVFIKKVIPFCNDKKDKEENYNLEER